MSNVSNRHTVTAFVAGVSQPLSDQRLARVICKQTAKMTKDGIKALPSVCASIPMLASADITAAIPRMMEHIRTMLEDAQDGIIRARYEASHGELTAITDDDISVDQCIAFMDTKAAGNRISAESVTAWFKATANDYVVAFIADKLRFTELTPDAIATCQQHANAYRDLLCTLAGGKTILPANQLRTLRMVLSTIGDDDTMAQRLLERITAMETSAPKKVAQFLDLSALAD